MVSRALRYCTEATIALNADNGSASSSLRSLIIDAPQHGRSVVSVEDREREPLDLVLSRWGRRHHDGAVRRGLIRRYRLRALDCGRRVFCELDLVGVWVFG